MLRADMGSSDPISQFSYLAHQLRKHNLAYIHVTEPRVGGNVDIEAPPGSSNNFLRQIWCEEGKDGVFIGAGGYTRQTAIETVDKKGGMAAFGRFYISNVSPLGFPSLFCRVYLALRFRFRARVVALAYFSSCAYDPSFINYSAMDGTLHHLIAQC
jgi:hypothetical protein